MSEFEGIYSDLTRQVINAAIEVHTELGCRLKEVEFWFPINERRDRTCVQYSRYGL